jgi:pyruvate formate-lyase activating enzyme-like uncharacterized protein
MVNDNKRSFKMNVNEMTMSEVFGHTMAARGVTVNSTVIDVMTALVDTTRQATEEVAEVAKLLIYDLCDGAWLEYMKYLTETPGEYISNHTGEVVSVTMIP